MRWLKADAPDYINVRKGARAAVTAPIVLIIGLYVIDDQSVALYAVFACVVGLNFADYGGPVPARARAYLAMIVLGGAAAALGAALAFNAALAVLGMFVVGFGATFLSSFGGYAPLHVPGIALAYSLSVLEPLSELDLAPRLIGWGFGGAAALVAALVLWPLDRRTGLIDAAADLIDALRDTVDHLADPRDDAFGVRVENLRNAATAIQQRSATPLRPYGPTERELALFKLIENLQYAVVLVAEVAEHGVTSDDDVTLELIDAALARSSSVLHGTVAPHDALDRLPSLDEALVAGRRDVERSLASVSPHDSAIAIVEAKMWLRAMLHVTIWIEFDTAHAMSPNVRGTPSIETAPEIEREASDGTSALIRRTWIFVTHDLDPHGVILLNSVRAGSALAVAVLLAEVLPVEHGFWIVLATLLVLRSSAATTSTTALAAVTGTVVGVVISAGFVLLADDWTGVLWVVFVVSLGVSGYAPARLGVATGQGAFAVLVVALFMLLDLPGFGTGIVRIETVTIGAVVAAALSLVLWPRGARGMLARSVATAYRDAGRAVVAAVGADDDERAQARTDLLLTRRKAEAALVSARAEHGEPIDLTRWIEVLRPIWLVRTLIGGLLPPIPPSVSTTPAADSVRSLARDVARRFDRDADDLSRTSDDEPLGPVPPPVLVPTPELDACLRAAATDDERFNAMVVVFWSAFLTQVDDRLRRTRPALEHVASASRARVWLFGPSTRPTSHSSDERHALS